MKRLVLALLPLVAACSGSSGVVSHLHPYRIDVRQGNLVTQDMASQLKPGQSKDQVRFILGTPLVADMFHANRWDYVYRFKAGADGAVQERRLIVFFDEDGKLARVGGDVAAAEGSAAPARSTMREIDIGAPEAAKPEEKKAESTDAAKPEPAK